MTEEQQIWTATPSQVLNLPQYVLWGLFFWLVIPIFVILWKWLVLKNTHYELTSERLRTRSGVLNKKLDELELYRVRDFRLEQPLFLRLFGLSNIVLQTSDRTNPVITLAGVRAGEQVREYIRTYVEACRQRKGVRELDVE